MPKIFSCIDGGILFFVSVLLLTSLMLITERCILDLFYLVGMLMCFIYYLHIKN